MSSHGDFEGEIERVRGQRPAMERHQWWLGPVLILVLIAIALVLVSWLA